MEDKAIITKTLPKEVEIIMPTIAEKWIQQGIEKGIEKGMEKGRQEGIQQGLLYAIELGLKLKLGPFQDHVKVR